MANGRYNARRRTGQRSPIAIVTIVCDDTDTAPAYFQSAVAREIDGKRYRIVEAPCAGAGPDLIIRSARDKLAAGAADDGDTVWALIDLEMAADSDTRIKKCRALAEEVGVKLALSQPCFEVWILAHFESTGRHFASCAAVLDAVKRSWREAFRQEFPQKKAQADYRKLTEKVTDAVRNARRQDPSTAQSWTEVWKIFAPDG